MKADIQYGLLRPDQMSPSDWALMVSAVNKHPLESRADLLAVGIQTWRAFMHRQLLALRAQIDAEERAKAN